MSCTPSSSSTASCGMCCLRQSNSTASVILSGAVMSAQVLRKSGQASSLPPNEGSFIFSIKDLGLSTGGPELRESIDAIPLIFLLDPLSSWPNLSLMSSPS